MKLLLTADWHFGLPDNERALDFTEAVDELIIRAREYKPDLILHGGDVFHSSRPGTRWPTEAAKRLRKLVEIAPVVVAPGNHDTNAQGSLLHSWDEMGYGGISLPTLPRVMVMARCSVICVPWLTAKHLVAWQDFHAGASFDFLKAVDLMLQWFKVNTEPPRILLAHASMLDARMGKYLPATLSRDPLWPMSFFEGFDLAVLGHFHRPQVIGHKNGFIVYPGSIERVTFAERDEPKGFFTCTLGEEPEFHELHTRPMVQIECAPQEVEERCAVVPDDAMLKIKLELGELDPVPEFKELEERLFRLIIEPVRPKRERGVRLSATEATTLSMVDTLRMYFNDKGYEHVDELMALVEDLGGSDA